MKALLRWVNLPGPPVTLNPLDTVPAPSAEWTTRAFVQKGKMPFMRDSSWYLGVKSNTRNSSCQTERRGDALICYYVTMMGSDMCTVISWRWVSICGLFSARRIKAMLYKNKCSRPAAYLWLSHTAPYILFGKKYNYYNKYKKWPQSLPCWCSDSHNQKMKNLYNLHIYINAVCIFNKCPVDLFLRLSLPVQRLELLSNHMSSLVS